MKNIESIKYIKDQNRLTPTELVQAIIKADVCFNVIAKTAWAHNGVARGKMASVLDSEK